MLLAQSRTQHLFNLVVTYCFTMLVLTVVTLFTHPLSELVDEMLSTALKWFAIFSVIFLWLAIFNSGWSKLTERGVTLDDHGIGYVHWGREVKILWHEITGWNVKEVSLAIFLSMVATINAYSLVITPFPPGSGRRSIRRW